MSDDYNVVYEIPIEVTVDEELSKLTTTSAKIRYLNGLGIKRTKIADLLNIRYQHVRNVLTNPPKKG